jgi:hypothetical protein
VEGRQDSYTQPFNLYRVMDQNRTNAFSRALDRELTTQAEAGATERMRFQYLTAPVELKNLERTFGLNRNLSGGEKFFKGLGDMLKKISF